MIRKKLFISNSIAFEGLDITEKNEHEVSPISQPALMVVPGSIEVLIIVVEEPIQMFLPILL